MLLDILLTLFLVFLNGFFVAAEFSIVKVRSSQLELRMRAGSKIAIITKNLVDNLDSYLSATQLGITLASLGLGWIGESVVANIIHSAMNLIGLSLTPELTHEIALPAAFITITMLHIIFGELAPKTMAIQNSEKVAISISLPLRLFYWIFRPFIWLLNSLANLFIRSLGFKTMMEEKEVHSPDELRYLIEESTRSGVIEESEHELIENIFEFSDIPIKQIMVPRGKIAGIEVSMNVEEILDKFEEEGYSRMPVYEKTLDNVVGIMHARDLLSMLTRKESKIRKQDIRKTYFVQEEDKINDVFRSMQKNKTHLGVVIDEFGGTAGLVTMEDIIEEIVGEIQDEYDEEPLLIEKIDDGVFKVKTLATIDDANDYLPVPLPDSDDYETVGGLILNMTGYIPEINETIELDDYLCTVLERNDRSMEFVKLEVKKLPEEEQNEE